MSDFPDLNQPATQADLAHLLGLSRAAIRGHHEAGVFTAGENLGVWLRQYTDKLRTEAAGRGGEQGDALRQSTIRLNEARAQKTELEIAEREGELVAMADVHNELSTAFIHMKSVLEAAGNRIATALSAQYGIRIDKRLLDTEIKNALSEIANYSPQCQSTD